MKEKLRLKGWVKETLEGIACLTYFGIFMYLFWLIFGV